MRYLASADGHIHYLSSDPQAAIDAAGGNVNAAPVHEESVANYHGMLEIVDLDAAEIELFACGWEGEA